ncbi:MAG TPA: helix-turn-helix transcriptional regulator [Streptosporangiaceae bacterium]|nr:helix-turn-helix transcriptional regulator [Streptosporangiaceae bacterium]
MPGPGNVGDRVRNLRLTKRLSQAQLAGHDLSDSYISLIESGKRTPTPAVLRLLAERLGCTAEYLADGIEPEQRTHLEVRGRYADLALRGGDLEAALKEFDEVIARSDSPILTARARWGRARTLEELGRTEEAILAFEEIRESMERDSGRASTLPSLVALTRCYHAVGDLGQAIALGERALDRLSELGLGLGTERNELSRVLLLAYIDRGDVARAHDLGRAVLGAIEASGDPQPAPRVTPLDTSGDPAAVSEAYRKASVRALELGSAGDALYLADQALAVQGEGTRISAWARLRAAAARALLRGVPSYRPVREGNPAEEALELLGSAAPHLEGIEAVDCAIETARARLMAGDLTAAVQAVDSVLGELDSPDQPYSNDAAALEGVRARLVLAQARLAQNDRKGAREVLRVATARLEKVTPARPVAQASRELGDLLEAAGDEAGAALAYRRALEAAGLYPAARSITVALAGK